MSTLTSYNQLQVVTPDPNGDGGLAINDNFKMLSTKMATTNPGATDDSDSNYAEGSIWYNTGTNTAFICVNATVGAAVWHTLPYSFPTFSIGGISTGQGIFWNGTEFVPLDTTATTFVLAPHDSKPFTFSTDGSGNGQISCNSLSLGGATFNANNGSGSGGGSWSLDGGVLNLDPYSSIQSDGSGDIDLNGGALNVEMNTCILPGALNVESDGSGGTFLYSGGNIKMNAGSGNSITLNATEFIFNAEELTVNVDEVGFFGADPASQQTGGPATAGATWNSTSQGMLNAAYAALRAYGLLT